MKKVITLFFVMVLAIGLLLPMASVAANTEAAPETYPLYAGQDILVGTVSVWNDGTNLYVKYETTGDWVMTETHLAVANSPEDFPQTKKGNPIPGHFTYSADHNPAVAVYEVTIALDSLGDGLFIAAHAVVMSPIEDSWDVVWMIGDVETIDPISGLLTNYADEFNWGGSAGPATMGPGLNAIQPVFADPFIVGTTDTNKFPYNSNFAKGYATDFDVQWSGDLPFGGNLTISWSPGQSATETKVVGDGITTTSFSVTGTYSPGQGWFMDKYPLVENSVSIDALPSGVHTINFQHTQGDGTFWDWILLEKPCVQEETAWAKGTRFVEKGNWATYFTYHIQGWEEVETLVVLATSGVSVPSSLLENGESYLFEVSGTFTYNTASDWADAEWYLKSGVIVKGDTEGSVPYVLDLSIDGYSINMDWGDYNSLHTYSMEWTGTGASVFFSIHDSNYTDNAGSLTVTIYKWE